MSEEGKYENHNIGLHFRKGGGDTTTWVHGVRTKIIVYEDMYVIKGDVLYVDKFTMVQKILAILLWNDQDGNRD